MGMGMGMGYRVLERDGEATGRAEMKRHQSVRRGSVVFFELRADEMVECERIT
jgi:hypothetical protein